MQNIRKLIAFCEELNNDTTVELNQAASQELRNLTFDALSEVEKVELELGPVARDRAREAVASALSSIT